MKPLAYAIVLTFLATSAHASAIPGNGGSDFGTNVSQPPKNGGAKPGNGSSNFGSNVVQPPKNGGAVPCSSSAACN